jgi:hypothetical protein
MAEFQVYGGPHGSAVSPGGFEFGVQGWSWGDPRPKSITFFLDNTAKVCDQHGRPIRGTVVGTKEVLFAAQPPSPDDPVGSRKHLATHAQVIAALAAERIDWQALVCAGWPQLPYAQLVKLPDLPPTPLEELRKIADPALRKDALKARREVDEVRAKELAATELE